MEPKVVQAALSGNTNHNWKYPQNNFHCQQSGSANNWAYGYNTHGPRDKEKILELCRKNVEQVDNLHGLLIMMSLAGGTGSGLGLKQLYVIKLNLY